MNISELLKKIRNFFIKDKIKMIDEKSIVSDIPETKQNLQITNVFDSRYKLEQPQTIKAVSTTEYQTKPNTIESAIEQYLSSLLYRRINNMQVNSYGALTALGGIEDRRKPGKNPQNESIFLSKIRGKNNFSVIPQNNVNGEPAFFHIIKGKKEQPKNRLYLNCRRENVAVIANELVEELSGADNYYFKFNSDKQMSEKCRSEKFVFYLSDDPVQVNNVLTAIDNVKQKRPELFKDSECVNPFLKTLNKDIMYAPEPNTNKYIALNGEVRQVDKSYNSLLAAALDDSYYATIADIVAKDYSLSLKTGGVRFKESVPYTYIALEEIMENPEKKKDLITGMKNMLEIAQKRNPTIQIKNLENREER